jgi:putative flippase GtrA
MSIKTFILQLSKYGFFGVVATLIHLLSAWGILYISSVSVFVANTVAFFIAFGFSYVFQTLYVFQTHFHWKKFVKFFSVQFGSFLLSYLLSDIIKFENDYIHTLIIVAIMPVVTFTTHKFWTFKEIKG